MNQNIKTVRDLTDYSFAAFSNETAIRYLAKKEIKELTYADVEQKVISIRKALYAKGYSGKKVALLGASSPEWVETYYGITTGTSTAVPLDAMMPVPELIELINRSDSEALFLSEGFAKALPEFEQNCPALRDIVLLTPDDLKMFTGTTDTFSKEDAPAPSPNDIAVIIFTSGTTGKSKGVMLSQNNLAENVTSISVNAGPGTTMLSVLPIHHAYCLAMDWMEGFYHGAAIAINDSLLHIARNMKRFAPDIILMVPLMIESIYKKLAGVDPSAPKKAVHDQVFGPNLKWIYSGGAALNPFYLEKYREFGVEILQGYGMSECSPVITSNSDTEHKDGTVGKPLPNAQIRIVDGEIQVKGSSVMQGYYKMPEETAATLEDGWLHTGDEGNIDEDGYLTITGRTKNLIILSNGENVSPEIMENKLLLSDLIGEIVITGEPNGLIARIFPDPDAVKARNLSAGELKIQLQDILDRFNAEEPTYRRIVGLVIRENPFRRNSTRKILRRFAAEDEPLM